MKRLAISFVILCAGLTMPAVAQTPVPSSNTQVDAGESAVTLNEEQKQAVIDAAVAAKSHQKTPKDFSPSVGAIVPKEVYLHGFKPEVTEKTPLLKKYSYAYLDQAIVLAGGPQSKVVAVITLPENLAGGPQTNHGAAEASTSGKGGTPPTGSVPSHTSPESVK